MASTASTIIVGENGSTYSMRSDTAAAFHHTQACGAAAAANQSQSATVGRSRRGGGARRPQQEDRRHEGEQVEAAHGDRLGEAEAAK